MRMCNRGAEGRCAAPETIELPGLPGAARRGGAIVALWLLAVSVVSPPNAEAISLQAVIDGGLSLSSTNGELTFSNFAFSSGGGGCVSGPGGSLTAQTSGFRYDSGLYCGGGGEEISLTFAVTASTPIDSVELTMSGASIYSIDPAGIRVQGPLLGEYSDSAGAFVSVTHADPIPAGFVCTDPGYTGFCTFAGTGAVSGADTYVVPPSSLIVESAFTLVGAGDDIGDPQFDWAEISYSTVPEPSTAVLLGICLWGLGAKRRRARPLTQPAASIAALSTVSESSSATSLAWVASTWNGIRWMSRSAMTGNTGEG